MRDRIAFLASTNKDWHAQPVTPKLPGLKMGEKFSVGLIIAFSNDMQFMLAPSALEKDVSSETDATSHQEIHVATKQNSDLVRTILRARSRTEMFQEIGGNLPYWCLATMT